MSRRIIIGGRDVTEHIQRTVARAPRPSPQQIARLHLLFAPPPVDAESATSVSRSSAAASPRTARRPHVVATTSLDITAEAA